MSIDLEFGRGVRCPPASPLVSAHTLFRGGLVFKPQIHVYHSTLGWRVIKKKKMKKPIPCGC